MFNLIMKVRWTLSFSSAYEGLFCTLTLLLPNGLLRPPSPPPLSYFSPLASG